MRRPIVFVWENFGPMHADRIDAVARHYGEERTVIGIEIYSQCNTHGWTPQNGSLFEKRTLSSSEKRPGFLSLLSTIVRAVRLPPKAHVFLCHYERLDVLLVALWLRLTGHRVITMGDSKFDDYPRYLWRELAKTIFLLPYHGAISGSTRSADYLRFLGIRKDRIFGSVNAVSLFRWRECSGVSHPPDASGHPGRPFVCVARLVPKKNLSMMLSAYALYRAGKERPRGLEICGSGELEQDLRTQVHRLGLDGSVQFNGFLQSDEIAEIFSRSLALILPSKEEQFGYAVLEAMACGLPVILTDNCGARDVLVRSGVNGFVVEPDNPEGLAFFMDLLCRDPGLWTRMARASWDKAAAGDAANFAESVARHVDLAEC